MPPPDPPPPPDQSTTPLLLTTTRLTLLAATTRTARAAAAGPDTLALLLGATIAPDWPPPLMADALEPSASALEADPTLRGWSYWFILARDINPPTLIGAAGFKGRPEHGGRVDIGYSIVDSLHRRGYGTEATRALIEWAFSHPEVTHVIGETLDGLEPSIKVMQRCGFNFVGRAQGHDPGDPEVLQYRLDRPR